MSTMLASSVIIFTPILIDQHLPSGLFFTHSATCRAIANVTFGFIVTYDIIIFHRTSARIKEEGQTERYLKSNQNRAEDQCVRRGYTGTCCCCG
jgi:hypothetical protein